MTTNQSRVQRGVPAGGQFATTRHDEPDGVDLPDAEDEVRQFPCPSCARVERLGRPPRDCLNCGNERVVTLDPAAVRAALMSSRDGRFRRSRPPLPGEKGGVFGAAYVWRMIRFDTGADLHMPAMAGDYVGLGWVSNKTDAPLQQRLDELVDRIGTELFGSVATMRGAAAWGRALGMDGAARVYDAVESRVGMPMGNGYAVGGRDDSPEAFLDGAGE